MRVPPPGVEDVIAHKPPFGVNELRLSLRQWFAAAILVSAIVWAAPFLWKKIEKYPTGKDYRLPYDLSKDYWLYQRRLQQDDGSNKVFVYGDSVVWGEYVNKDGTLSHFLNQQAAAKTASPPEFINAGINGLFPLALDGLAGNYCPVFQHKKILVHCNLLWMSSPKADLQTRKEEKFNHALLVPQFSPRIPSYKASFDDRVANVLQRNSDFLSWGNHLKFAYFNGYDLLSWTLLEGSNGRLTNLNRNPLRQITFNIPTEPSPDPLRGPDSPRHKPWSLKEGPGTETFEWVSLESSLQWAAFQRLCSNLRARGNSVLVVVGPLNEHMMTPENLEHFSKLKTGVAAWLTQNEFSHIVPELLPSKLYADTSHPLTEGYRLMAERLATNAVFSQWLNAPVH
jgi:hypothetical protein